MKNTIVGVDTSATSATTTFVATTKEDKFLHVPCVNVMTEEDFPKPRIEFAKQTESLNNFTANPADTQKSMSTKVAEKILLQMRGVTLTPEDADAIVEELGHVAHGWGKKVEVPAVPSNFPTAVQIVNGVVTPTLQVLLYDVLSVIDASIQNKEQNRAVKRIIHDGFDKAYMDIIREAYPDSNFAMGPGHALTPLADKSMAIQKAISKV
jgi:hypothetical protein